MNTHIDVIVAAPVKVLVEISINMLLQNKARKAIVRKTRVIIATLILLLQFPTFLRKKYVIEIITPDGKQ